jgi:hypothetical protein
MTLHPEILNKSQQEILPKLGSVASENGFYLAGGTTVALYLGHRQSVDFDWFAHGGFDDPPALAEQVRRSGLQVENVQFAPRTLHAVIGGVRVSYFDYPYGDLNEPTEWPGVAAKLASLDDLACMKLAAIAQRGSRKDFIDLYAISLRHKPLSELVQLYRRKYLTDDVGHVLVGLTYFDDADAEPSPTMLQEMPWDEIKRRFALWVRELAG